MFSTDLARAWLGSHRLQGFEAMDIRFRSRAFRVRGLVFKIRALDLGFQQVFRSFWVFGSGLQGLGLKHAGGWAEPVGLRTSRRPG